MHGFLDEPGGLYKQTKTRPKVIALLSPKVAGVFIDFDVKKKVRYRTLVLYKMLIKRDSKPVVSVVSCTWSIVVISLMALNFKVARRVGLSQEASSPDHGSIDSTTDPALVTAESDSTIPSSSRKNSTILTKTYHLLQLADFYYLVLDRIETKGACVVRAWCVA